MVGGALYGVKILAVIIHYGRISNRIAETPLYYHAALFLISIPLWGSLPICLVALRLPFPWIAFTINITIFGLLCFLAWQSASRVSLNRKMWALLAVAIGVIRAVFPSMFTRGYYPSRVLYPSLIGLWGAFGLFFM